ncbi:MAG: hypothetical protein H0V75_09415 [Rubrobacter sp.]|nr:hypothetical protein [Rubrobacter sp.]
MKYSVGDDTAINCPKVSKGTENLNASDITTPLRRILPALAAAIFVAVFFFMAGESADAANVPANDDMANATVIRGDTASIRGNNRFATREKDESDHIRSGASVGQNSTWHRWTAWTSGSISADVCRSKFDAVLAIYTKNDEGKMEKVADNDDGCSARNQRGSSFLFEAELEETYWIAVSGYSKASAGPFTLRLAPAPPAEAG